MDQPAVQPSDFVSPVPRWHARRWADPRILLALYCLVCLAFFLIRTAHWKLVNDPAQLNYVCFLIDHGMTPYRDLLEINMPGIYLVNWSVMHTLGGGSVAWRAFDVGLMALAAWAMIYIARPYDWLAGLFGATLFLLYHGRDGAGQQGQRDFIIAVLLLCAYAALFSCFRKHRAWPMFVFGLCTGIASTIKPTPLPFALLLLLAAVWRAKRMGDRYLNLCLYAVLGFILPLAAVLAFLVSHQSLGGFWYLLRTVMPFYQALGRVGTGEMLALLATGSVKTVAFTALAIAVLRRHWGNWEHKLLIAGILFGIASYFVQRKAFPYHRYSMLAFLFLWAGLEMVIALRERGFVRWLAIGGIAFAAVTMALYVRTAVHKVWAPEFTDALTTDLVKLGGAKLSGHVQCIDTPADCDATLYDLQLRQSTGLFYDYLIFGSGEDPVIREMRARFWQQFQANPPQVIVVATGLFPRHRGYGKLDTWPLFQQELANAYDLYAERNFAFAEAGPRAYRLYVRKPG